jgi:hypothetical protein
MKATAASSWIGVVALTASLAISTAAPPASIPPGRAADADLATEPTAVVPHAQIAYERNMIDWARDLFDEAGLELPYVKVRFSDDPEGCEGNQGTLRTTPDGDRIIRICADHDKPGVRDRWRRRALVHEFAHLWEQTNLDNETRQAFMAHRELDNWNDRSAEWRYRATEHAAEMITWGLIDFGWLFVALPDNSCDEMLEGYRILTGLEPTNGPDLNCTG